MGAQGLYIVMGTQGLYVYIVMGTQGLPVYIVMGTQRLYIGMGAQ